MSIIFDAMQIDFHDKSFLDNAKIIYIITIIIAINVKVKQTYALFKAYLVYIHKLVCNITGTKNVGKLILLIE